MEVTVKQSIKTVQLAKRLMSSIGNSGTLVLNIVLMLVKQEYSDKFSWPYMAERPKQKLIYETALEEVQTTTKSYYIRHNTSST